MSSDEQKYSTYSGNAHLVRKTRQIVMLYEGMIRCLQQAKAAIEKNDIQERFNSLAKACEILNGLQISLDFNEGGDIAQVLYDYYAGLDSRISSIHFSNDKDMCDVCIEHIRMMKNAWDEIDQNYDQQSGDKKSSSQTDMPSSVQPSISDISSFTLNC